ncbi:hypothetical protein [Rhizobium sp. BK176]|uniref:hypothetical protein n=1 Tax=Rhizobium sp. BK176 TaxID=2587071 RepID=UPI002166D4B5|nr:hypothetical protein [Rhizobium sp. BK176]MCS4089055.1 putative RNase H-like HicB family nuclease [Rhizobium sp. BK176]
MELARDLVRIEITRLPSTGMFLGVCPVLRGLFVHGRDVTEMEDRIPQTIRHVLEDMGYQDIEVEKLEDEGTDDVSAVLTVRRYQLAFRVIAVVH